MQSEQKSTPTKIIKLAGKKIQQGYNNYVFPQLKIFDQHLQNLDRSLKNFLKR
jgi:hypothetical protein